MMSQLKAAAKAGPNVASKMPAEKGAMKAMDKVLGGNARHVLHPGSSAGLKAEPAGLIEHKGMGYRDIGKGGTHRSPSLNIKVNRNPHPGGAPSRIHDMRMPKHAPAHRDKELSGLL